MKKTLLLSAAFTFSSVFAAQVSVPGGSNLSPSPDSQSSTSPRNAPSLTDPSAKPITPPTPPEAPAPIKE